jgi:hypothetical protein
MEARESAKWKGGFPCAFGSSHVQRLIVDQGSFWASAQKTCHPKK